MSMAMAAIVEEFSDNSNSEIGVVKFEGKLKIQMSISE